MSTINLGGAGGQYPGEDGQDGASVGGGIGGKGGKGGTARVVRCTCDWVGEPALPHRDWCDTEHGMPEPDVGMALAAVAAELRRTGQIDGNAEFEVETDGVHFRVVN